LIGALQKQRPDLFDTDKEYIAYVEMEGNSALKASLQENALVTVKPRGWDWDVEILEG
jgi:hypothetical protein